MTQSNSRSTIMETMARGICGPGVPCEACRLSAERALTALEASGMAVVASEPTARMVIAGASAKPIANRMNTLTAAGVWAAMLAASPYGKSVVQEASAEGEARSEHTQEKDA